MILLSFDVEEFDLPLEYGCQLAFSEQIKISTTGTSIVLHLLKKLDIKATFFVTANYAINQPEIINKIIENGHELASHGFYHSSFVNAHLLESKLVLEKLSGKIVKGFRMPRMMPVDLAELNRAGYRYNTSINPTWLPGRYNHFDKPRTWFAEDGILQLPSSVTPVFRFPLFWLSFHNVPIAILKWLSFRTWTRDNYLNIYFHPWEFTDLKNGNLGLPSYISRNSGEAFIFRIRDFILYAQKKGIEFGTISQFLEEQSVTEAAIRDL